MSKQARVFVPLVKVDEEQRLVYGVISAEELDQAGEVMDYETSKPNFQKWSSQIEEASGGLSKGNLRVMHGLNVAGKLTDIVFDDEAKQIEVCAKVVDDAEWTKVTEGCYTGFSVGGKYAKKWNVTENGQTMRKYTADPKEVSLVDNPCVKSATFQLVKADGVQEEVPFSEDILEKANMEYKGKKGKKAKKTDEKVEEGTTAEKTVSITNEQLASKATELAKADGKTEAEWADYMDQAREELTKAAAEDQEEMGGDDGSEEESLEAAEGAEEAEAAEGAEETVVEKVTPPGVRQVWTASDGKTFEKKADAEAHEEDLTKAAAKEELTEAEQLAARLAKAETPEVIEEQEPASIFSLERLDDLHKAVVELETPRDADGSPKLEKGMYTVSRFADMLRCTADLARTIKAEGKLEEDADDASVADSLKTQLGTFGEVFLTYAQQQVAELIARLDKDMSPARAYDYYYHAAGTDNDLAKTVVEMMDAVEGQVEEAAESLTKAASLWAPEPAEEDDTLQKRFDTLSGEHEEMKKVAELAVTRVEELAKRLQTLEEKPEPRAPNGSMIALKENDGTFLGKSATTEEDKMTILQDLLKTHGPDELAVMMIKASHASGGQQLSLKS